MLNRQHNRTNCERILMRILHCQDITQDTCLIIHISPCLNRLSIDRLNEVACLNTCFRCWCITQHAIHLCRNERLCKQRTCLNHWQHIHIARQSNTMFLAITQYIYTLCLCYLTEEIAIHIRILTERTLVCSQHYVMVMESQSLCISIETHTHTHVRHLEIAVSPYKHHH